MYLNEFSGGENTRLSFSSSWESQMRSRFCGETYLDIYTDGLSHMLTDGYRNTLTGGSCDGLTKTRAVWRSEVQRLRLPLSPCPQNNLRSVALYVLYIHIVNVHVYMYVYVYYIICVCTVIYIYYILYVCVCVCVV